jgi:uncharacterized protein YbjT (DUF2867 family)
MQKSKAAVCLGSTGAVGQKLLEELAKNPAFSTVVAVVRKPSLEERYKSDKVVEYVVKDMSNLEAEVQAAISEKVKEDQCVGFSTLGVGHGTASLTIDQHRAVDVELNATFARGLKSSGKVNHFVFMSAVGSNPKAWDFGPGGAGFPRYSRVKGEAEEAVKAVGLNHDSIMRPAAILGIPNTPKMVEYVIRLFSFLTPSNMLSIRAEDLARSMAVRGAQNVSSEQEKIKHFHYPEMMDLLSHVAGPS